MKANKLLVFCCVFIFTALWINGAVSADSPYPTADCDSTRLDTVQQVAVPDTAASSLTSAAPTEQFDTRFKPTQLIAPLSLMAVGTAGYYSNAFGKLNVRIRDGMTSLRGDNRIYADDWLQFLPAASYLALGFYKKRAKLNFKERIAVEATACITVFALSNIAKASFKEPRPHSTFDNSFPSGHTAFAFTGAELIRKEYGWGLGGIAYGVATGVAFLRMYNGQHWFNDVIAGAGLGILSANIGYWMLNLYRRWFHWEPNKARSFAVLSPSFNAGHIGLNLNITIL